jgi:class 3 adenylate cyclase
MECGAGLGRGCGRCGAELPAEAKFCPACGQAAGAPERDVRDYTPKHLAKKILQSRSALEGERKQVTVLFADVKGSMELAEAVDPEDWHAILDRFFQILTDEDHAQRACHAALYLRDALREFSRSQRRERELDFQARIGLNSGDVVVGKIGDDLRMDYTAQGHTVGLAERMQQLAEPGKPYLTDVTAALVKGYFRLDDLGEFPVKGIAAPVRAFALEGAGELRTRLEVSRARGFSRFVGRADEMATLELALHRSVEGSGQVVGVLGEAGVGKSRLCAEFVERCRAKGIAVHDAHCPAHGKAVSLQPIRELLRSVFGILRHDGDQLAREKITGCLLLLNESFREALPLVFDFLAVPDPEKPAPKTEDPRVRQRQLYALVRRLVRSRSEREPAVLLVDDLHWIDEASDGFLAQLVEAVGGTRTLLLVNFRPEYHADWVRKSYYQQLPLSPLSSEAVDELLEELLGHDPSVANLTIRIREHAGGNPFFLEEVVQSLAEAGTLEGTRGAYRMAEPIERLEIPTTVQAVLAARIDRLAECEKQVLQTASVIGRQFSEALLLRVAELPHAEVEVALSQLQDAELIREEALYPDVEYAFKHPLTQEVALESQLRDHRARTHAAVARSLEQLYGDSVEEHATLVAHHWAHAGERLEAAEWFARAVKRLGRWGNPVESRRCHEEIVNLLAGKTDPTRTNQSEAQRAGKLVIGACINLLYQGWQLGDSHLEADALLERVRSTTDLQRAAGILSERERTFYLGSAQEAYGNWAVLFAPESASSHLREAVSLAERAGDEGLRLNACRLLLYAGWAGFQLRLPEVQEIARREIERPPTDPPITWRGMPENDRPFPGLVRQAAMIAACLGQPREGLDLLEYALALTRPGERPMELDNVAEADDFETGQVFRFAASCCFYLGDADRMSEYFRRWRTGRVGRRVGLGEQLLLVYQLRGEWNLLVEQAESILQRIRRLGLTLVLFPEEACLALIAEARAHLGQKEAAAEAASRILERTPTIIGLGGEPLLPCARALVWSSGTGAAPKVKAALERAEQFIERTGANVFVPFVHEIRTQLALICGDEPECARERAEAERLWTAMGAHGQIERMYRELEELRGRA